MSAFDTSRNTISSRGPCAPALVSLLPPPTGWPRATFKSLATKIVGQIRNAPPGLFLDKGYDYDETRAFLRKFSFPAHIRCRGEDANATTQGAGFKSRRWVVERTHSWMNRFRRILVRWRCEPTPMSQCCTSHSRSSHGGRAECSDRFSVGACAAGGAYHPGGRNEHSFLRH